MAAPLTVWSVATAVFVWGIGTPSPWRDEVVSVVVARRGPLGIFDLVRDVDLVHALYYLTSWAVTGGEPTVLALRYVSAAAFTAAAVITYLLGTRLGGQLAGLVAAALVVSSPLSSRYAQEARPYALVTLAAALSTLLLLRLLDQPNPAWRATVPYSASVVVLVLLNTLAVLLLISHVIVLLGRRPISRRGFWSLGASALVLAPYVVATAAQRNQVGWLPRPRGTVLVSLGIDVWGSPAVLFAALAVSLVAAPLAARAGQRGTLAMLLAWGYLPPLLLWSLSQLHPLYDRRYVVYSLPGAALAFAVALGIVTRAAGQAVRRHSPSLHPAAGTALLTTAGVVTVAAVAIAGLGVQSADRGPIGHTENLRGAAVAIAAAAHQDQPILYDPDSFRLVTLAFPTLTEKTDDVALCRSGASEGTILGGDCSGDQLRLRLAPATSVLLLTRGLVADGPGPPPSPDADLLRSLGFVQTRSWPVDGNGFLLLEWSRPQ